MADQSFTYIGRYLASGGSLAGEGAITGTLYDSAGGNTFETTDTSMDEGLFLGETGDAYVGTWSDGTNTFIVCLDASSGDHYIYGPAAPIGGFPATLTLLQSDPSWSTGPVTVQCFHAGTRIDTPDGVRMVETLCIGDRVLTAKGAVVPVKWIGRHTVAPRFGPAERLMPVRFAAGSLGDGLPHEPLTVTADHGMLVDGVICHAGALVNGSTITQVPLAEMGETYTVYHIETDAHGIILANGAPAETFIDNVSRRGFDNFAEFETLYGDVPEMQELSYPRAMSARQVPGHIHAMLAARAAA